MQTSPHSEFDVDFSQASKLGNTLLEQLSRLREIDPIHWSPASQGWLVTRHADIDDALQGKFPLSLKRIERIMFGPLSPQEQAQLPTLRRYIRSWPVEMDAPEHTRLRKLLVKAFSRKVVESQRPFVRERVNVLMDRLERQPTIEFNEEIARQLPGSLILRLLGVSQEKISRLREWANAIVEGVGVPYADMQAKLRAEQTMVEMTAVFAEVIESRRRQPLQDDLVSALLAATEDGDRLSEDEMIGAMQLVLIAGHDTTSSTLTLGLAALTQQPDLWRHMYDNPSKILDACLELMRHMAMSTAQPRLVTADFEWHGKKICQGEFVWLMLAAANRDPRVFADPERLDPTRVNDKSMVFDISSRRCRSPSSLASWSVVLRVLSY
jgi:cytochrome P450